MEGKYVSTGLKAYSKGKYKIYYIVYKSENETTVSGYVGSIMLEIHVV